jgi:hypothetical protein
VLARGVTPKELPMIDDLNFGGLRAQLDADVTAEELEHIATLLRGPHTTA